MPPQLILDIDTLDVDQVVFDTAAIESINPHRYEMRQLDAIIYLDRESGIIAGYKDLTEDEFWVRGHIPGRPIMPGVLMVEAAAQLASILAKTLNDEERFIGFGGIENTRFRLQVTCGERLYLMGKFIENRPRRFKLLGQGIVDGKLVFETTIIGMPI